MKRVSPALMLGLASIAVHAEEPDIIGQASIIDGDTIVIRGTHIRLFGIDAPESGQTCTDYMGVKYLCGQRAAFVLADMIEGKTVVCHDNGPDIYGRTLAHCFIGAQDIQAAMVRQGWALAFRKYSLEYVKEEKEAIDARAGMWSGEFIEPWRWRHDRKAGD